MSSRLAAAAAVRVADAPVIRARQAKTCLGVLREHNAAAGARLSARCAKDEQDIERAAVTDWIDLPVFIRLMEAAREELGEQDFRRASLLVMRRSLHGPLINSLWEAGSHLFGMDPASLLSWAPRAWATVYKNVGEARWDREARALVLGGLPEVALRSTAWIETVGGAVEAVYERCRTHVSYRIDLTRDTVRLQVLDRAPAHPPDPA